MLKPQGYVSVTDPYRPVVELDTITCKHCQMIVAVKPGSATTVYLLRDAVTGATVVGRGAFCLLCMAPVCPTCGDKGTCTPWERQLEAIERQITVNLERDRNLAALGIGA